MPMPTKKKRKIDPMLIRAKEDKRIKRIEKALKKMQKKERLPKPLREMEPPQAILKEIDARKREVGDHRHATLLLDVHVFSFA